MIRQATLEDIPYLLPFVKQFVEQKPDPFRSGLDFYARIPDFTLTTPNGHAPVIGVLRILDNETAWLHLFGFSEEILQTQKFRDFIRFQVENATALGLKRIVTDAPLGEFLKSFQFQRLKEPEKSNILQLMKGVTEFKITINPESLCVLALPAVSGAKTAQTHEPVIRHAVLDDASGIWEIINHYALHGEMLPKSLTFIQQNIRNYTVVELDGKIVGCAALQLMWNDLAEVASVGITEELRGKGMGQKMVQHLIERARQMKLPKIFALTRQVAFFEKLGFQKIPKETLPPKIWKDCMHCTKFMGCDEVAMILHLTEGSTASGKG